MKQLSALGARRHFFRNPRRMRALRPGELDDNPELMGQPGFYSFSGQSPWLPDVSDYLGDRWEGVVGGWGGGGGVTTCSFAE